MNERQVQYPIEDRWTYLWLVLAFVLTTFSISVGKWIIPLAAWLGGIFTIRFMRTQKRAWLAYLLLAVTTLISSVIALPDFLGPLTYAVAIGAAVVTPLAPLADRVLGPRLPGFAATLVFPVTYTALEFINNLTNPLGSFGTQAYAILDNLPLLQLASITGMWGLSFLMGWFASTVNWVWERDFAGSAVKKAILIYGGVAMLALFYGQVRLWFAPSPADTVRIAGVSPMEFRETHQDWVQAQGEDWSRFRQMSAERADLLFAESVREARAGAQLVVWPEFALPLASEDEAAVIARGQELAKQEGIYLGMSVATTYTDDTPYEQKFLLIEPAGHVVIEHFKYAGGAIEPGRFVGPWTLETAKTPFGVISAVICHDTDFPGTVLQAGRNGADILLSPSAEFEEIGAVHAQMATFRAIENGVSVVRVAVNGLSMFIDPYGRVLARMDHYTEGERVIVAQVPTAGVPTLYPIIGDLFGWLAIVGFVALTLWAIIRRRRQEATAAEPGVLKPA